MCGYLGSCAAYIYIYMLHGLYARVYIAMYTYMQGIYAYTEPRKHMYRSYIYVFYVYLFVFVHYVCCIFANECKLVQTHASLHITIAVLFDSHMLYGIGYLHRYGCCAVHAVLHNS